MALLLAALAVVGGVGHQLGSQDVVTAQDGGQGDPGNDWGPADGGQQDGGVGNEW
jgi:hypothetical protein